MIVFDDQYRAAFFPLAQNRSVGDLRCGILKLRQRLQQFLVDSDETAVGQTPAHRALPGAQTQWLENQPALANTLLVNSRSR